jgi:hypothetical protein
MMQKSAIELERFKKEINLTEFAASLGYSLDRSESSLNSVVMRREHDKVIIGKRGDGHWTYFSIRDRRDNGSIIDFFQNRQNVNLGEVRKHLRLWLSGGVARPAPLSFVAQVEPSVKDRRAVEKAFSSCSPCGARHDWLFSRGIRSSTLCHPRFAGCIYTDERKNAVFPHFDRDDLCGFEIRNTGFHGFAKHGEKSVWRSSAAPTDSSLVITESALDALSYFQLFPDEQSRFLSIGGQFSPFQVLVLEREILSMPERSSVFLAFDNDPDGELFSSSFFNLVPGYIYLRKTPIGGKDWNDLIRS